MAEHGTRKTIIDRLEEALSRLTIHHESLAAQHSDLASDYQATPEEECITLASFYLDGSALSWFQWSYRNGFISTWPGFLQALETRFPPTYYEDPKRVLFKLTQCGSINDYLTEFERLANQIIGLPPPFLLSCFISGLSPEIHREVLAL